MKRQYDTEHRPIGFTLQTSGSATELKQTHAYNGTTGLLNTVSVQQGVGTPRVFAYSYESGTALLDKLETGSGGTLFSLNRDYESGNNRDLVSSIAASYGAGSAITDFDYTYRDDRRRATARQSGSAYADYGDGSANSESIYYRYNYNFRGELTEAVGYLGTNVASTTTPLSGRFHEYGYDGAGNRTTSNPTGDDTVVSGDKLFETSYTVNALNQIEERENPFLSVSGTVQVAASGVSVGGLPAGKQGGHWSGEAFLSNGSGPAADSIAVKAIKAGTPDTGENGNVTGVIAADPETISYDDDGNLIEDSQWDYIYNQRNQLIKMTSTLPSTGSFSTVDRYDLEFVYDDLGRRVEKKVTNLRTSAVTTRRYIYDGWNLVGEYAVSSGTIGSLTRSYAWGLDIAGSLGQTGGVGALLQMSVHASGMTDYYPTYDANGNVTALVESDGSLAAVYEYDPYGQMVRAEALDSAVAGNPFRFSTKFTDVESGLIYYGHRYYSASLGRFINRDPIGEQGGINLYAFVGNDPVNSVDVLGLLVTLPPFVVTGNRVPTSSEPPKDPTMPEVDDELPWRIELPPIRIPPVKLPNDCKSLRARFSKLLKSGGAFDNVLDAILNGAIRAAAVGGVFMEMAKDDKGNTIRRNDGSGNAMYIEMGDSNSFADHEYIWGVVINSDGEYYSTWAVTNRGTASSDYTSNPWVVEAVNAGTLVALPHSHGALGPEPSGYTPGDSIAGNDKASLNKTELFGIDRYTVARDGTITEFNRDGYFSVEFNSIRKEDVGRLLDCILKGD